MPGSRIGGAQTRDPLAHFERGKKRVVCGFPNEAFQGIERARFRAAGLPGLGKERTIEERRDLVGLWLVGRKPHELSAEALVSFHLASAAPPNGVVYGTPGPNQE